MGALSIAGVGAAAYLVVGAGVAARTMQLLLREIPLKAEDKRDTDLIIGLGIVAVGIAVTWPVVLWRWRGDRA